MLNDKPNHVPLVNRKQIIAIGITLLVLLGILLYWWYQSRFVVTDDAYVNANVVQIAPQVDGQVNALLVDNNQYVKAGQTLFTLDPKPFQIALAKAQGQLLLAEQAVTQDAAALSAAKASVAMNQAKLQNAKLTAERNTHLLAEHMVAEQVADNALAEWKIAQAELNVAKAKQAQATLGLDSDQTQVIVAKTQVQQAELNLQYTIITAPVDGQITNLSLRVGDVLSANQAQFALIAEQEFWVDANFKETQLAAIKPGQIANVVVDVYPNHHFRGIVQSISGGSGAAFSLLPPENATGNWVKVTQRVPVKIVLGAMDPRYPLQIGTSATVSIDLRQQASS